MGQPAGDLNIGINIFVLSPLGVMGIGWAMELIFKHQTIIVTGTIIFHVRYYFPFKTMSLKNIAIIPL